MSKKIRYWAHGAIIAALYAVLTHMQNLLLPGSASWAIQCRLSEMLCVLALFTPAAIPGLTLGCLLFNITFSAALPLVFDRFHKLDKSRSQNRDGWGLGLYIVKTIVSSHGENISVTSRDGKTEFTFTMPLVN